ncbi:MAG TPA: IS1595 family transposase [Pseudolabrys sp.]|uniref:IS1595 family transposase n=1 Tax=Pseudolabrys sp. TaxID=1960880 RepID=UPI002DDCA269|nr:IS1595 family transposase [Pseudolabrys sp.]HEV2629527.1 IS1595 family transposase [Pseudolabrys sp.]
MTINLTDPVFTDEAKAREHLEEIRWPDGPVCPHCGSVDKVYRLNGTKHRPGLIHCNNCDGSFTVTTGSVMESSHVPLNKWVLAFRLMASSKKGMSAHQLHRTIVVTYKTAWFMAHRIREAMRDAAPTTMGGEGRIIESDETYWGPKDKDTGPMKGRRKGKPGHGGKSKIVSLVERDGRSRSFKVDDIKTATLHGILRDNVSTKSRLMTDEGMAHNFAFVSHEKVHHGSGEYARGDVTTNTVEGFFGVFKRGMRGTYQHCGEQHLQRYLDEFDFRYSNRAKLGVNDTERAALAIKGAAGKRLTYRQPRSAE